MSDSLLIQQMTASSGAAELVLEQMTVTTPGSTNYTQTLTSTLAYAWSALWCIDSGWVTNGNRQEALFLPSVITEDGEYRPTVIRSLNVTYTIGTIVVSGQTITQNATWPGPYSHEIGTVSIIYIKA